MFRKIKKFAWVIVRFIQKVVVCVSLSIIYILILGITKVLVLASGKWFLDRPGGKNATAWIAASGYEADTEACQRQS